MRSSKGKKLGLQGLAIFAGSAATAPENDGADHQSTAVAAATISAPTSELGLPSPVLAVEVAAPGSEGTPVPSEPGLPSPVLAVEAAVSGSEGSSAPSEPGLPSPVLAVEVAAPGSEEPSVPSEPGLPSPVLAVEAAAPGSEGSPITSEPGLPSPAPRQPSCHGGDSMAPPHGWTMQKERLETVPANKSMVGCRTGEKRAAFIANIEQWEQIRAYAYWHRLDIKDVMHVIIAQFLEGKQISPIPSGTPASIISGGGR